MNRPESLPRLPVWNTRFPKRLLPLGFLLFFLAPAAAGQVLLFDPGRTYNNTDSRTFDLYGAVDISNCTSVSFSIQYSFSLPWEGSGNMEYCDEINPMTGQPFCFSGTPCACNPATPTAGSCFNCWDFLWVRFLVDGVEVGGGLIGDSGTTNAEQSGTITFTQCTNGLSGNASIEVYTQTWAMDESVTFSNVTITCIDDSPTLAPLGPFCQNGAPVPLSNNQGGVAGTWSGNGVVGASFSPAAAGVGTWTLTFTANPGECAGSSSINVTVNPAVTPALTPIAPVCQTNTPLALPASQSGVSGAWSGPGVSGNAFNPALAGAGSHTLTFTPNPGQCASPNSLNVTVNPAVTPTPDPLGPFCTGDPSVALPTIVDGISGAWTGSLVVNNVLNPAAAGNFLLTFNPAPGQCANPAGLMVLITPATTPMLTPQGPFCGTDPPVGLPLVQSGIAGSWAGNGVTGGNTFNPGVTGSGSFLLTFIPAPGECANNNSISVMVSSPLASPPGQPLTICYTLIPFSYTDNLAAIIAAINNGTGQQVNWYLDAAATNPIDPTDPADIQALILGGPNQTVYAAVFNGTCESATVPVNVQLTPSSTPALTPIGPFCQGSPPVNLPASQSGVSGAWSGPGVVNNTFNPFAAGNFTLTFTPAAGQCAGPASLSVAVTPAITPALNPLGPFCQGSPPVSLPASQSGIAGSWSGPGVTNNSFNPASTGAGTFSLTFTPNPGQCANPNSLIVTVGDVAANSAGPLTACGNGSGQASFNLTTLNPQVSQGAGTVNWYLNPAATIPINNPASFLAADGQQVYATVSNGACQSAAVPVQLFVLPLPIANPFTLLECEGANGLAAFNLTAIAANVNGGAPTAVSWSFDPAGISSVPNPAAFMSGSTTVYAIVSDGSCRNSAPVTLIALDAPTLNLTVASPISCSGAGDGSLQLTVSGGQPAYQYDWNANALDGIEDPSGLGPGAYSVTVADANGCASTAGITLAGPDPLVANCAVTNPVLTPGGAEGEASVSFSGGTPPFSISWAGPVNGSGTAPTAGTILLSDLLEGTYTATVQDARGCTATCIFTVNGPGCDLLASLENLQGESCPGASDGAVNLLISGGTAPYAISWSDGAMNITSRSGLAAGAYSVTVNDSGGCQASRSFTIANANPAPQATISRGDTVCSNECFAFDIQLQGAPPFLLEYAVDTGINRQFFTLFTSAADTVAEVCAPDFGYTDGLLEVLFLQISDANCTDSLGQLDTLLVKPAPSGIFNLILCPGDSLVFNGTVFNAANPSGTETLAAAAANGCDSLVAVSLAFFAIDTTLNTLLACDPAQAGIDTLVLQSSTGCDSVAITETIFVPADTTFLTRASCDPAQAGLDTLFLQNAAGCDSLVITETSFDPNAIDLTMLTAQSCDPAAVGLDTLFLQNAAGCDSLVVTETVLLPSDETFLMAGSCDPAAVGMDTLVLQNAAGCDSLVVTETVLLPSGETFLMAGSCDPAAVGMDTLVLQNAAGCDSLVVTETVLLPSDETFLTAGSCDPAAVGVDTLFLQNAAGCDSLVVTETVLLPSDETFLTAGSCDPAAVGMDTLVLQNAAGCDSLVVTETVLLPSDETFLTAGSCDPAAVGLDTLVLQNAAGCDSLVITETTLLSTDTTFIEDQLCSGQALVVNGTEYSESLPGGLEIIPGGAANGCDSLILVNLSFIDTAISTLAPTLCAGESLVVNGQLYDEANPTGTEVIENGAANGCDSVIQVALAFTEGATGFLEGGQAICPGESVELTLRLQGADAYNVNITDGAAVVQSFTGITGDVSFSVTPTATATYEISLLTAVGSLCPVEIGQGATVTVVQAGDIQAQLLSDFGGYGVSCGDSQDGRVGVSAAQPGLSYLWNTGQSTPVLENVGAGVYTVTVTSSAGCSLVDSVRVNAPEAIVAKASSIGVDCFSEISGSILVESLEGGAGPYEYSLDGQSFRPLGALPASITGLSAGMYTLYLQDANDCQAEEAIQVAGFEPLSIFLGADETIKLGDSVLLRPLANFDIAAFTWSPLRGLLDSAALNTYVKPDETTAYTLMASDSAGCPASDQILIFVDKARSIYAPNIFSPNEDGRNDFFTLFAGPDVAEIRIFRIFDRWGNLLFERGPLQPNIENLGWDGTFNGEPLDPAVFAFYAEVEFVDGFVEVVKGDVVLMR